MNRNRLMFYLLLATVAGCWIVQAGDLEPAGPPNPTMKDLTVIPSAWSKLIISPLRFEIVMESQAALDHETGLVWELIPSSAPLDWWDSTEHCMKRILNNRMGWRLPAAEELFSLIDTSQSPALPAGHPFTVLFDDEYWTKTHSDKWVSGQTQERAFGIAIGNALVVENHKLVAKIAWCVRGGAGYDNGHGQHIP